MAPKIEDAVLSQTADVEKVIVKEVRELRPMTRVAFHSSSSLILPCLQWRILAKIVRD